MPGRDAIVADTLCHAYLEDTSSEISETDMVTHINTITNNYPMSDDKLNSYREATASVCVCVKYECSQSN